MIIYPEIAIHNGNYVNLKHGSIDRPKVSSISPQQVAKEFEKSGAQWLHVVDLDRVFDLEGQNTDIIRQIIKQSNIPVQVGGGIRSASVIEKWLNYGAERIVLGTAAVTDQHLVTDVCVHHPGKIVISIDARDSKVVTHGWQQKSSFSALELVKRFERVGAGGIIYTDIDLYDELPESSMANTVDIAMQVDCPVISSGTVRSLDDVSTLSQLPNIAGVVIGWALFEKQISLEGALKIANQQQTKAEFI